MSGTAASLDAFAQSVERDTGERGILSGEGVAAYALGGRTPALVARPGSHEAAARTLPVRARRASPSSPGAAVRGAARAIRPRATTSRF